MNGRAWLPRDNGSLDRLFVPWQPWCDAQPANNAGTFTLGRDTRV